MTDRCRVFALNGEELFPCRWAKAKKLVAANVAKKATIDGKMCIQMLELTRMNKPQEAIMYNEVSNEVSFVFPKVLYQFVSEGCGYILEYKFSEFPSTEEKDAAYYSYSIYNNSDDDVDFRDVLAKEIDIFTFGCEKPIEAIDAESNFELEVAPIRVSLSQAENDKRFFQSKKLEELQELNSKLKNDLNKSKQEDGFLFPDLLYQYAPNFGAIVVLKLDGYKTNKVGTYYYSKGDKSTDGMGPENINKDMISDDNISNWNFRLDNWPFRTKLSLAIEDFENQRICDIKRFEDKLQLLRSNSVPKIIG